MKFNINGKGLTLHFLAVTGSSVHGLKNSNSDTDLKGVFSWDLSVTNQLVLPNDSLEASNVPEDDWNQFLFDLKSSLNINFEIEDDITFMDSRKFFLNLRKNELNMLDLVHSNNVIYSSPQFNLVIENKALLYDFNYARSKFIGLSGGALKERSRALKRLDKEFTEEDNYKAQKNLARSIHVLYIVLEFIEFKEYSSKLRNNKNLDLIKKIRSFEINEDFVLKEKDRLINILDSMDLNYSDQDKIAVIINNLLLSLNLVEVSELINSGESNGLK